MAAIVPTFDEIRLFLVPHKDISQRIWNVVKNVTKVALPLFATFAMGVVLASFLPNLCITILGASYTCRILAYTVVAAAVTLSILPFINTRRRNQRVYITPLEDIAGKFSLHEQNLSRIYSSQRILESQATEIMITAHTHELERKEKIFHKQRFTQQTTDAIKNFLENLFPQKIGLQNGALLFLNQDLAEIFSSIEESTSLEIFDLPDTSCNPLHRYHQTITPTTNGFIFSWNITHPARRKFLFGHPEALELTLHVEGSFSSEGAQPKWTLNPSNTHIIINKPR